MLSQEKKNKLEIPVKTYIYMCVYTYIYKHTDIYTHILLLYLKSNTNNLFQLTFEIALESHILKYIRYTASSQQTFVELGFIYIRTLCI